MYRDRAAAGRRLAARVRERVPALDASDLVVQGLAPGGMPVAREVAVTLGAALDVVVALRLGAPGYDDLSIGGVAAGGTRRLDERTIAMLGVPVAYVDAVSVAAAREAERLAMRYRGARLPVPVAGRTVIVVDDGAQARYRTRAAIAAARRDGARRVVFAVPVAPSDALEAVGREADIVVCDFVPERHAGAAAYYGDFDPPRPESIRGMLSRRPVAAPASPVLPLDPPPARAR